MKKALIVLSCFLISCSMLTLLSCGGNSAAGPASLSLATADNTYGLSTDPELQAEVTKLIQDKTKTVITPIVPPLASYNDKLSILINSGDIPDVVCVNQAMARVPMMVARGLLLDLTDYIAKSPSLSKLDPVLFDNLKINGKIYSVPYNYPKAKAIYLRKDIMDKYGIKLSNTPTTEEFRTEMKKLVGTGITPFCFPKWVDNFQYFYNSFGAWGGVYQKDGKYIDGFQTPEMKEALTYIRQLYVDGVLNQEFITVENSQMREKTYTAQAASDIDYVTNYVNYVQNTNAAKKPTEMFLLYKLVGPRGEGGALNEATQTAWAISAKSKSPAAAMRVIETLVTDPEVYPAFYGIGVKDKHYTLNDKKEIVPTDKAANSGYKYTLNYLSDSFININVDKLPFSLSPEMKAGLPIQIAAIKAAQPNLGPNHSADVPVGLSENYDRVMASIKSTRESIAAKIIVGSVSVDDGMKEYANFWTSIGGAQILDELNTKK